jgi:hypothetical protein
MRRVQSKCRERVGIGRPRLPIYFPFPPLDCLPQSGSRSAHFETPLIPSFCVAYNCHRYRSNSTSNWNRFPWFLYPLQGATREPKSTPFRCTKPFAFSTLAGVAGCRQVLPFSGCFNRRFPGVATAIQNEGFLPAIDAKPPAQVATLPRWISPSPQP